MSVFTKEDMQMKWNKVWALTFSPTGGTVKVADTIAEELAARLELPLVQSLLLTVRQKTIVRRWVSSKPLMMRSK